MNKNNFIIHTFLIFLNLNKNNHYKMGNQALC